MATTNDKVRREAYRRSLTSTSSRDLTMASGSTEDLLLPRPVRSTSSSSSYAPLAPLNTTGNRLRSRSLVQRGVIDTSLTSPVDPTSSRLPTAIHESDTGSEDSSEVGPDTPVEHYTQGQPWSGGRAKGKAREVIEQAGDVVYSFAVPGPTPALERGRANSDVRVMASAIGGGHQAQPATATLAKPFAILLAAFVGSTCVAIVLIATVPTLSIPHSVADALAETRALRDYANTSYTAATHIFAVLCALFVYKQAFSGELLYPRFARLLVAQATHSARQCAPQCLLRRPLWRRTRDACHLRPHRRRLARLLPHGSRHGSRHPMGDAESHRSCRISPTASIADVALAPPRSPLPSPTLLCLCFRTCCMVRCLPRAQLRST